MKPNIDSTSFGSQFKRAAVAACLLLIGACGGGGYGGGGGSGAALTMSLSANPTTVLSGQDVTLTWSSAAGATCTASGAWSGSKTDQGSETVAAGAAGPATYTLACSISGGSYGSGSSATKSVSVTVNAASGFTATALVADVVGSAALVVDPSLVNPWGIAFGPGFSWVANNHTESSTLYDGNGRAQPTSGPLVVQLPDSAASVSFDPTGVVFNGGADFVVSAAGKSGAARFLFVGEGGMLAGWSPAVDITHAVIVYTDAANAVYKGLALANNGTANFLYAADFHNGKVDVFDVNFARQTPSASSFFFTDPSLPAGYSPFNIQAFNTGAGGATQLYVTYAEPAAPDNKDNVNGAGLGLVDVYDTNGDFIKRLISPGGRLNAPWGLAVAPSDFGTLSGTLLVGNFGDGKIHGYDLGTGNYVGSVVGASGSAFAAPGLWGIAFGNDADNQPHNTLFYAAGLNNEANGVYGRIDLGGQPILNAPPVVTMTTAAGAVSGMVSVSATATADVPVAKVEFFADAVSIGTSTSAPYSVQWDTSTVPNATAVLLTAKATDIDDNVGSSAPVEVTAGTMTLSQLQVDIFTPRCSGCHNGVGTTLPGVQNLTAGSTFAALVDVASLEQAALKRVKPTDVANSYVIRKLEGATSISGVRMPAGGPYLSKAEIDQVKTWINNGALNN